jgi:hypothetical protein
MKNTGQEFQWHDLQDIWATSSQTRNIHIQMSDLLDELKGKVTPMEKDSIKRDIATLKASWSEFKSMTSQFEKNSVKSDLAMITRLLRKFLNLFKNSG